MNSAEGRIFELNYYGSAKNYLTRKIFSSPLKAIRFLLLRLESLYLERSIEQDIKK